MHRKRFVYGALLLLALLGLGVWVLKPRGDAVVYQGKTIRTWAMEASLGDEQATAALRALGTNAVPGLVDLLQRRESIVRKQFRAAALKLPRRLSQSLLGWSPDPNPAQYRVGAARALGLLGRKAGAAIPALRQTLHDADVTVRWAAATALSRIGEAAVPELMSALADADPLVRQNAAYALGQMGAAAEPALPALIESFTDTNRDARAAAVYSASIIGLPSMLAVSNVLAYGDSAARTEALHALMRFQRSLRLTVPVLVKMAQSEDATSRQQAIQALGALRIGDEATVKALTRALDDRVPAVRAAAVRSFSLLPWRAPAAVPHLIARLKDDSPEVRQWTVKLLGEVGLAARPALPELQRLAAEDEPGIRAAAAQALKQIEPGP